MRHTYTNADLRWLPSFHHMVGPRPPDDFVSNGVTCGPDIVGTADLRPAAHWHDFGYSIGGTELSRYQDDWRFNANLKICGLTGIMAPLRLAMYYRVRFWGHWHFNYEDGCQPKRNLRFYARLLLGRYVRW